MLLHKRCIYQYEHIDKHFDAFRSPAHHPIKQQIHATCQVFRLLADYNPKTTPHKPLKQICTFNKGTTLTKKDANTDGSVPVIAGGTKPAYFTDSSNREAPSITISSSGTAGYVWWHDEPIFASDCFTIAPKDDTELSLKYLYYALKKQQENIYQLKQGSIPHVYAKQVGQLEIPLPSLPVQHAITTILDTLTTLEQELEQELEQRNKQYQHYVNHCMRELAAHAQKCMKISDIFDVRTGYTPSKKCDEYWMDGRIPWFTIRDLHNSGKFLEYAQLKVSEAAIKRELFKRGSLVIDIIGSIGNHAVLGVDAIINQQFAVCTLKPEYNDIYLTDFLFYLGYYIDSWCLTHIQYGAIPKVDMNGLRNFYIPIVSKKKQQEIIELFNPLFDVLKPIDGAISTEISHRNKQYYYYLNLLIH